MNNKKSSKELAVELFVKPIPKLALKGAAAAVGTYEVSLLVGLLILTVVAKVKARKGQA